MKKCRVCDLVEAISTIQENFYEDADVTEEEFEEAKQQFRKNFYVMVFHAIEEYERKRHGNNLQSSTTEG